MFYQTGQAFMIYKILYALSSLIHIMMKETATGYLYTHKQTYNMIDDTINKYQFKCHETFDRRIDRGRRICLNDSCELY